MTTFSIAFLNHAYCILKKVNKSSIPYRWDWTLTQWGMAAVKTLPHGRISPRASYADAPTALMSLPMPPTWRIMPLHTQKKSPMPVHTVLTDVYRKGAWRFIFARIQEKSLILAHTARISLLIMGIWRDILLPILEHTVRDTMFKSVTVFFLYIRKLVISKKKKKKKKSVIIKDE